MPYAMPNAYVYDDAANSLGWSSVTPWAASASVAAGIFRRQLAAPAAGNERIFVCTVAGTTAGSEPSWVLTKGAKTTDNTVTWMECTGRSAFNGAASDVRPWAANTLSNALGDIIKNVAATHYFICTTAGNGHTTTEPTWNTATGGTTVDNGTTWTCVGTIASFTGGQYPHARLRNALASTWSVAGDNIYVNRLHTETEAAAISLTGQGTTAAPMKVLSTNWSTFPPATLQSGAQVSNTGTNSLTVSVLGYLYGIIFSAAGGGANIANLNLQASTLTKLEDCTFRLATTSASARISLSQLNSACILEIINPSFLFSDTAQRIQSSTSLLNEIMIRGGSAAASGSIPGILFACASNTRLFVTWRGGDLSQITGTILQANTTQPGGILTLENCKLGAAVAMASGAFAAPILLRVHNCDSGALNYRFYEATVYGVTQQETTIVRQGGASDGATPISLNVATSANTSFYQPYKVMDLVVWNDVVNTPITTTIEFAGATALNNAKIWSEAEYLGNASFPISSVASNRAATIFSTPVNHPTSVVTWDSSPAVKQKLENTLTARMKGWVRLRVYVAEPSITAYLDPLVTVA